MGIGDGGETLPDTQEGTTNHLAQWTAYGYSDAVWLATIEKIATTFREDFRRTPVVPLVDSSFYGPTQSERLPGAHQLVRDERVPHAVRRAHLFHDAA